MILPYSHTAPKNLTTGRGIEGSEPTHKLDENEVMNKENIEISINNQIIERVEEYIQVSRK